MYSDCAFTFSLFKIKIQFIISFEVSSFTHVNADGPGGPQGQFSLD